jgi:flagellar basal body-associated protein FliL
MRFARGVTVRKILILTGLLAMLGFAAGHALPACADDAAKPTANVDVGESAKPEGGDKEGKDSKKVEDVSGGRFAGDPVYVHLTPMVFPAIDANGVEQLITLQIAIEVKDFDTADTVHTNMPRIRDALMQGLYGGFGEGGLRNGQMVDVAKVKAKATAALDNLLGPTPFATS